MNFMQGLELCSVPHSFAFFLAKSWDSSQAMCYFLYELRPWT
jgi:hypothetical protein